MNQGYQFKSIKQGTLVGMVRTDLMEPAVIRELMAPDDLLKRSDLLFKNSIRTTAGRIFIANRPFFLKRYNNRGLIHTAKSLFRPSRPERVFHITKHMHQNHITTPAPAAILQRRMFGFLTISYLVTDYIHGRRLKYVMDERKSERTWIRNIIKEMASLTAAIHGCGVVHGDMKANNFVVEEPFDLCRIWVVDLDGARLKTEISDADRIKDMGRLLASFIHDLSHTDLIRFLIYYTRQSDNLWTHREEIRKASKEIHRICNAHEQRHTAKKSRRRG